MIDSVSEKCLPDKHDGEVMIYNHDVVYEFGKPDAACVVEEKDDVSHFAEVISIPQECLVAKRGGDVRIYKSDGVYSFHCIFANHAISFELKEKDALKLIELIKKEQSRNSEQQLQNSGYSGAYYYYDNF